MLKDHTNKLSGDIFVFRHAFPQGKTWYTEGSNSEFVEGVMAFDFKKEYKEFYMLFRHWKVFGGRMMSRV